MCVRMTKRLVLLASLTVLPLSSCDSNDTTTPPEPGVIQGYIGEWDQGMDGIGGITLELDRPQFDTRTTVSDQNGFFQFRELFPGEWWLVVEPDSLPPGYGYAPGESWERPVRVDPGKTTHVDIKLELRVPVHPGELVGSVVAGEDPVPNARIELHDMGDGGIRFTDTLGRYGFYDLDPGDYTLTITPPTGYALADGQEATRTATVEPEETTVVNWELVVSSGS